MASKFEPQFHVRGTVPNDIAPGQLDEQAAMNGRGDLCIAQSLPPLAELVRLGQSYMAMQATGVAPVAALPTTTAMVSLWNGEPQSTGLGKCYVVDSVCVADTTSQAAASSLGIVGMINPPAVASPGGTLLVPISLSGRASYRGSGTVALAKGSLTNNVWFPIGNSVEMVATANAMSTMEWDCRGMYILPPGAMMNFAIVSATTVATSCIMGIRWHEVLLALG